MLFDFFRDVLSRLHGCEVQAGPQQQKARLAIPRFYSVNLICFHENAKNSEGNMRGARRRPVSIIILKKQ